MLLGRYSELEGPGRYPRNVTTSTGHGRLAEPRPFVHQPAPFGQQLANRIADGAAAAWYRVRDGDSSARVILSL